MIRIDNYRYLLILPSQTLSILHLIPRHKNPNDYILNLKEFDNASIPNEQKKKNYTPIKSYKPSGNLIYDEKLLNHMEDKLNS